MQQDLYQVFIDFKKAFDRVWHEALWFSITLYIINANLIRVIDCLRQQGHECCLP